MGQPVKLMIVDDSSIIRKLIQNYLNEYHIEIVGEAGDGKSAVELFLELRPDMVTMDIVMPEMDGLSVIDEIRKIDPTVKIMVVTALSDKSTGIEAMKRGAKSYVVKPFTPDKLKNAFLKLLQ
jgi:two-component system, chemotaxis family, chemotaxis protein CheY